MSAPVRQPSLRDTHYNSKHFPAELLMRWFGGERREVAFFASPNKEGKKPCERYRSFDKKDAFLIAVRAWGRQEVHLGALYKKVNTAEGVKREIVGKELTFDVDLSDYAEQREICGCGAQKKACVQCWKIARICMKVLSFILRHAYGYKNFFHVFSGRRGFHTWVCDREVISLRSSERESILAYLDAMAPRALQDAVLSEAYRTLCVPFFEREIAPFLPPEKLVFANDAAKISFILDYTWPRFDRKVTTEVGHLTRMPLSVRVDLNTVCWILKEDEWDNPFTQTFTLEKNAELFLEKVLA